MKTLMIEDLSKNDVMDRTAMTHVSGGRLPQVMTDQINYVHDYIYGLMAGRSMASTVCYP